MPSSVRTSLFHRDRIWRLAMGLGIVGIPIYLLLPSQLVQQWAYVLFGIGAIGGIVGGVALHRPDRARAWLTAALGLSLVTGGDVVWAWYKTMSGEIPFPSVADAAYLCGYVLIAGGLLAVFRGRVTGGDRSGVIDATILMTGFGFVSWVFLMHPYLHNASLSPLESGIAVAYPLVDVLILGVAVRLALLPPRQAGAFRLMLLGLGSFLVGDSVYAVLSLQGLYQTGQLVDAVWLLGYVSLAGFGLHPSMRSLTEPVTTRPSLLTFRRLGLLAVASLMAPLALVIEQVRGEPIDVPVIAAGSVLLFVLVLARLAMALRQLGTTLSERETLEEQLKHQAQHDHLTGLANRRQFGRLLEETMASGSPVAVLFIDLDDFKTINDTLGHAAGDDLLVAVARRLRGALRPEDTSARLGGDEFAVFLLSCRQEDDARVVAERILHLMSEPFSIHGRRLHVGLSIGVAIRSGATSAGEELMRDADTAMYLAKAEGKGQVAIYRKEMHDRAVARLSRREQLGHAIANSQLVLHYQPIFELATDQVVGFEALVRWQHPEEGLLPPREFIPLAEETGLIGRLGEWVLRSACAEALSWPIQPGSVPLRVSVNLSVDQLRDTTIVDLVAEVLADTGLDPARLELEVTETSLVGLNASDVLDSLHALGVRIAIDDFGTGYSSLSYVGVLPVDVVKIDRSFVAAVMSTDRPGQVARLILRLGDAVDLITLAEGIETAEELEAVTRLGCQYGQGFFLARPMPVGEVPAFLAAQVRRLAGVVPDAA